MALVFASLLIDTSDDCFSVIARILSLTAAFLFQLYTVFGKVASHSLLFIPFFRGSIVNRDAVFSSPPSLAKEWCGRVVCFS